MKRFLLFSLIALAVLFSCQNTIAPGGTEPDYSNDPRLKMFDSPESAFIAYPGGALAREATEDPKGINKDPKVKEKCNKQKHSYMFFDDEAVIEYAPPPGDLDGSILANAARIEVELHNRDNPEALWWDYIFVPIPTVPPVTTNDPILAKWQWAFCLDDGTIVDSYQCTSLQEFLNCKSVEPWSSAMRVQLEIYNRDHDPDAHVVWGPEV